MYDIGQRYGKIIVESKEIVPHTLLHNAGYRIKVRCDCGNERYLFLGIKNYSNKNYTSCGCVFFDKNRKDIKDKKIGKIQVLKYNEATKSLNCVCECGNSFNATSKEILCGEVTSCGKC